MIKTFLGRFHKLPISNKAMVYLMWIYGAGSMITGVFVNIYVFKIHGSIEDLLIYNFIFYSFSFIGFAFLGWLMGIFQNDIKNMYYISYTFFIIAYLVLLIFHEAILSAYIFGFLFGVGNGAFWNAVHTQELKNIENKNRDFYSSSISTGNNITSVVIPFLIATIFYISDRIGVNGYWVLFGILPLVYLISFFFIRNIQSYIPGKIRSEDIDNFFDLKKYKYGHLYFLFGGILDGIKTTIIPIITIIMLRNEINIGVFQGVLTLLATYLIIHLSHKRQESSRFMYFTSTSIGLACVYMLFGWQFTLSGFFLYSLLLLPLGPVFRVSQHVYDLSLMDGIKFGTSDFYPAMILREVILWVGRSFAFLILGICLLYGHLRDIILLRTSLMFIGIFFILGILAIFLWEKHEKSI